MKVDMPTLALMTALAYLALPLLTWFALKSRRDLTVDLWCGGGLLASLGWFLSSMRGQLSDWFTLAVGYAFLIGSMVARAQALRISLALPDRARLMITLAALSSLAFCLAQWLDAHFLRGMIVRVSVGLAAAGLSWLAWQLSRKESSQAAGWIAITYALMSLGFFALVAQSALAAGAPRASGWSSYWTVPLITSMITAVVGHFGFAAIVFEREKWAEVERIRRRAQQDESHQLESRLHQLNRQRDLAVVASSLGHELSQPLMALGSFAGAARTYAERGHRELLQETLLDISTQAKRAAEIVGRIRGFVRQQTPGFQACTVNEVVNNVLALMRPEIRQQQARVIVQLNEELPAIQADRVLLEQVVLNLVLNALQAMQDKYPVDKVVRVETGLQGDMVFIRVSDRGPGIAAPVAEQLFEPFFTTKPEGLGLGLNICRTSVESHRGRLEFENAPQGGAIFTVYLPLES